MALNCFFVLHLLTFINLCISCSWVELSMSSCHMGRDDLTPLVLVLMVGLLSSKSLCIFLILLVSKVTVPGLS